MSATPQPFALTDLLARAGAHIRGRRADCPRCKRQRTVSFDESRGVYHCHGGGCDFSGGAGKLARELGLARHLSASEYRELLQNRERANHAAVVLYERVRARRFELMEQLRGLGRLEFGAHTKPNHPLTWDVLSMVYRERPAALAELTILENCGAADLLQWLGADKATRERVINRVIEHGGLYDHADKFVEVEA